jgi:hypothetical protein
MSDDELLEISDISPVNTTPEEPLKADTNANKALEDGPGLTEKDLSADLSSQGFDDNLPDLPDPGDVDVSGIPSEGKVARRIGRMTRMQVFDYVLHTGAVLFEDGRELISCAACDHDAVCGLRPTVHEITGNPIMVCTGPVMEAKHRFLRSTKFEAGKVKRGCPYHPDKRRDLPKGLDSTRGLSSSANQIDQMLKDKYSR